jgi:hypothetical protein
MSRLLNFYRGQGTDNQGRRLEHIWNWNDELLEDVHDFIQWLFPLPEPSQFNLHAPLLTDDDIVAFHSDETLRANLERSFERILAFLGLKLDDEGAVIEADNFNRRATDVWQHSNHNWLRVTRILRSLCLLGLGERSLAFFAKLADWHANRRFPIPDSTFTYWRRAVESSTGHRF